MAATTPLVLAEFFVVLAGILVALLLQAWWQDRSDHNAELAYLRQISADLQQTTISMVRADSAMRPAEHAGALMARAYQTRIPPPSDSVFKWLRDLRQVDARRPTLGAVEALMTTGDLRLIRNDSLRSDIIKYYDRSLQAISYSADAVRTSNDAYAALNELVDYPELMAEYNRITGTDERVTRASGPTPLSEDSLLRATGAAVSSALRKISYQIDVWLLCSLRFTSRNVRTQSSAEAS